LNFSNLLPLFSLLAVLISAGQAHGTLLAIALPGKYGDTILVFKGKGKESANSGDSILNFWGVPEFGEHNMLNREKEQRDLSIKGGSSDRHRKTVGQSTKFPVRHYV
jgi:hypothetical protein